MAYSSEIAAGDTALATQYNNLRKDALGIVDLTAAAGGVTEYLAAYVNGSGEAAHANASAAGTADVKGIIVATAAGAAACQIQPRGEITNAGWSFSAGDTIWLDTSAGGLTATPPSIVTGAQLVKIGWMKTATTLVINIEKLTP